MKVIVTRTHQKIVTMRLDDDGVLQVVANNRLPLSKVKEMVENQRDWINEQIKINLCRKANSAASANEACAVVATSSNAAKNRRSRAQTNTSREQYSAERGRYDDTPLSPTQHSYYGEMFSGKKCLLCGRLHKVMPTSEGKCHLDDNCIYIPQKYYYDKFTRLKTLKAYLKKLSEQHISGQISKFGSHASLCPTKIEFKSLPADQWIKCTSPQERVITLDYRICQLPPDLQHYLIVHAFSHFGNGNHDDDFWNTVSNHVPYYKTCLKQLSDYEFLKDITPF